MTCMLLPRKDMCDVLLKEYVVPMCLSSQKYQVKQVDGMVHYMLKCKKSNSAELPYESLITKLLVKAGISQDCETSSSTPRQIDDKSLSIMKVHVDDGNLENFLMEA